MAENVSTPFKTGDIASIVLSDGAVSAATWSAGQRFRGTVTITPGRRAKLFPTNANGDKYGAPRHGQTEEYASISIEFEIFHIGDNNTDENLVDALRWLEGEDMTGTPFASWVSTTDTVSGECKTGDLAVTFASLTVPSGTIKGGTYTYGDVICAARSYSAQAGGLITGSCTFEGTPTYPTIVEAT